MIGIFIFYDCTHMTIYIYINDIFMSNTTFLLVHVLCRSAIVFCDLMVLQGKICGLVDSTRLESQPKYSS